MTTAEAPIAVAACIAAPVDVWAHNMNWQHKQFTVCMIPSVLSVGLVLAYFIVCDCAQADTKQAQQLQQQAISRLDRFIDHFRRTYDRTQLQGELSLAESELKSSANMFESIHDSTAASLSWIKLGDVRRYREQWNMAIKAYQTATVLAQKTKSPGLLCQALLGHARAHLYGKRMLDRAKQLTLQAIPLGHQVKNAKCKFDSLDLLSQIQISQGDLAGAADSLNRAFANTDPNQDGTLLFYGYLDRADLYQKLAEKCDYQRDFEPCLQAVELADRDYHKAKDIAIQLGWTALAKESDGFIRRLSIRKNMIESQRKTHHLITQTKLFNPRSAKDVVISNRFTTGSNPQVSGLLKWLEQQGGLPVTNDARGAYIRGLFHEMKGDQEKAFKYFLMSTDLLEQDRGALQDERARGAFIEDKVEFYYTTILHLLERERSKDAFELMERARSRVMLDLIKSKSISLHSPHERQLYARQISLSATISQYQTCLFVARNNLNHPAECETLNKTTPNKNNDDRGGKPVDIAGDKPRLNVNALQKKLDELQRTYNKHQDMIRRKAPRLGTLTQSMPDTLNTLQNTLKKDNSELVAYLTLESQLLIWHVSQDKLKVYTVFLPRSELKRKVAKVRKSLTDPKRIFDIETAHQLYLYLLSPFIEQMKAPHLVIVPHEDLFYLPFQALHYGSDKGFIGQHLNISYTPSASVLNTMSPPTPLRQANVLAAADPSLRHAPNEVRALGDKFGGKIFDTNLLDESTFKNSVTNKQLVHLAVHGTFVSNEPLLSFLHLKKDNNNDGRLTAAEMYGLPLDKARLVTLSACETGSVKATHANEILGMTRGLLFSGAASLLLSSWKIDDAATSIWMKEFYSNTNTLTFAQASKKAIKKLTSIERYRHPYYWSPFMLISR